MKTPLTPAVLTLLATSCCALAQSTAFTYQGRLDAGGTAYTGVAEFQFSLWTAGIGGSQIASTLTVGPVGVANGLFTTTLDFGNQFSGGERWLEIAVRTNLLSFTTLSPRQPLLGTPYAITAGSMAGLLPANQLSGFVPSGNLGGTYSGAVTFNNPSSSFSGNGAGLTGLNAAQLTVGTVPLSALGNTWQTGGNAGTTAGLDFIGTTDQQPLEFKVNGHRVLRLENNDSAIDPDGLADDAPNMIAGSSVNFVAPGIVGAVIGGGGAGNIGGESVTNSVEGFFGAIGGGSNNRIGSFSDWGTIAGGSSGSIGTNSQSAFIGGGGGNLIGPLASYAGIAGGSANKVLDRSRYGFVGGGERNEIRTNSSHAAIGGGFLNSILANASYATIPGGYGNSAAEYAFAAGRAANAAHPGSFVWADSTGSGNSSAGPDTFNIRAGNGVHLNNSTTLAFGNATRQMVHLYNQDYGIGVQSGTLYQRSNGRFSWFRGGVHSDTQNDPGTGGVVAMTLTSSGLTVNGTFVSASDRDAKQDFKPVNPGEVLDKVVALPLSEWRYRSDDERSRHVGPMAQDFHAAFGLGADDKHIATVDADGVALAAIQGLNQKLEAQLRARDQELADLKATLHELREHVAQLRRPALNAAPAETLP